MARAGGYGLERRDQQRTGIPRRRLFTTGHHRGSGHLARGLSRPPARMPAIVQVRSQVRHRQHDASVTTFANVSKILPWQNGHIAGRATVSEGTCGAYGLCMRHVGGSWPRCHSNSRPSSAIPAAELCIPAQRPRRPSGRVRSRHCCAALAILRNCWSGAAEHAPARQPPSPR